MARTTGVAFIILAVSAPALRGQEPEASRVQLSGELGFVKTGGNTDVSSVAVGQKLEIPAGERILLRQTVNWTYGKTEGVETSNQLFSGVRGEYALSSRIGAFAGVNYSYNLFAGIKRAFEEIIGVSVKVIKTPKDVLLFDGGFSFNQETEVLQAEAATFTAGRIAMDYRHTFVAKTYLQQTVEWLPNFRTSADYRLNAETALVAPVSSLIGIKLGYLVRYRGQPPGDIRKTDTTLRMGLQFTN